MATDQEKQFSTAADFGISAAKTILQNQAHMLRLWADNIEKFAQVYENETDKVKSTFEQVRREHAAE